MSPDQLHHHLSRIGKTGGTANTAQQKKARRLNAYRLLRKRYPTSLKIQLKLAALEKQS